MPIIVITLLFVFNLKYCFINIDNLEKAFIF